MTTVTVRDETVSGREIESWLLPGLPARMRARELVRLRVREEVARFNAGTRGEFRGLVRPSWARETARGAEVPPGRRVDWVAQAEAACAAFTRNGFVMIAGERRVEDLDEMVDLGAETTVSFIRLAPLVGG